MTPGAAPRTLPTPESSYAPAPCHLHLFGPEHPDVGSRQEVHHHLVVFLRGKQLTDLHMSASACFPTCHLSHRFPECLLLHSSPAAMAEKVRLRLGRGPCTPPASIVLSLAEPVQGYSSGCMPTLQLVEPSSQRLHTCHWDRSLGPVESKRERMKKLNCLSIQREGKLWTYI